MNMDEAVKAWKNVANGLTDDDWREYLDEMYPSGFTCHAEEGGDKDETIYVPDDDNPDINAGVVFDIVQDEMANRDMDDVVWYMMAHRDDFYAIVKDDCDNIAYRLTDDVYDM